MGWVCYRANCESGVAGSALGLGASAALPCEDICLGVYYSNHGSGMDLEIFLGSSHTIAGICRAGWMDFHGCVQFHKSLWNSKH